MIFLYSLLIPLFIDCYITTEIIGPDKAGIKLG